MTVVTTSEERLAYGKEANWGATPVGVGASNYLRFTSVGSANDKQTVESAETANSVEVGDIIQVSQRGGIRFDTELSYGNLDDILESIFGNAWSTNVLSVGGIQKSLTFERQFVPLGAGGFWTYSGGLVSQLSVSFAIGKIITASVTAMSNPLVVGSSSAFTGGSTVAAPSNGVMDPITSLQLAQEAGAGSIAGLSEITLNLSRGIVDFAQIGSVNPLQLKAAQFVASGTFSCYYQDATYIAKHLSHATTSLAFTVGGASNLKYALLFNKVKLTIPDLPNPSVNQPLIVQVQWKAFKDATNSTCKITRTP